MARSWSRRAKLAVVPTIIAFIALPGDTREAIASATSPIQATAPPDPDAVSSVIEQGVMVHVFDTTPMPGGPYYVNDHTLIQGPDRSWHLFGIFHREPMGEDTEVDFVHAVAKEPDPTRWETNAFEPAPAPFTIALRADRAIGETHVWAPHVVAVDDRWVMVYQGGGKDGDRASMRLAESDDLYSWTRISDVPLFEDICEARDPMLMRRDNAWALYYTRCESTTRRVSGVAYRLSRNLVHWSEPRMVLSLNDTPTMQNSGYSESPFVFEKSGYYYLSLTSYPLSWDATMVYRSPAPFAFPDAVFTRLRAHAGEWLTSGKRTFLTHAGPGQRGVWISPIEGI